LVGSDLDGSNLDGSDLDGSDLDGSSLVGWSKLNQIKLFLLPIMRWVRYGHSGGLPTRPTRPGLGAPKARGPPRLGGPLRACRAYQWGGAVVSR
jgi:hypothetical protein